MRDAIFTLLRSFRGLDPLKRLVWQELNYDRVDTPLPIRDWPPAESDAFIGDPLLLAEHGEFKLFYMQHAGNLLREPQRALVNRLLQRYPYALFVFSNREQTHWHFVNVKYERNATRRRVFRRITVEAGSDRVRTAVERIGMLDLETISRDLFGIPPLAIQQRHDQAFDVEAVTREFYRDYEKLFRQAEKFLAVLPKEKQRAFTQKLFNRLMFIVFLERKNWLRINGRTDYLRALWDDYQQHREQRGEDNFYWNRLYPLFFNGLNYPYNLRAIKGSYFVNLIGDVPYLNGGLFDKEDDDDNRNVRIDDAVFGVAINDLFYRYNFTITESTPLDIEVAVDPEMLGKIFEELVTGRHESGSYYTPKPVVAFMCREGLKGFLRAALPQEQQPAIEQFVDEYDATQLRNPEAVLQALQRITVCDPACGSGAYLLGMMQELLLLRQALFTARNVDARSTYERKLEIIRRNIYGVDLDPFAVSIAQLRVWLSLIVDYELGREGVEPPLLPNLDYKIEAGDSLLGSDPRQLTLANTLIDEFKAAKDELFQPEAGTNRQALRQQVEQLEAEIALLSGEDTNKGFPWSVRFAEVFREGGFDVVLANPPYVRMGLFKDFKPKLRQIYANVHAERADLYIYFYARAIQMLRPNGIIAFISPNKWLRANYGEHLRRYIAQTCDVWSITDFGELPVFQTAATFPMIFVARKGEDDAQPPIFTRVASLSEPYPDVAALIARDGQLLPPDAISGESWTLTDTTTAVRLRQMENSGVRLGKYVNGQIYYGVKTGFNTAFVIDGATRAALIAQDTRSAEIIKPLTVGDDVRKWRIEDKDRWLLYMYHGIDVKRFQTVLDYMRPFKEQLEKRATKQEWYELQQPQMRYIPAFESPKIIFPDIAKESRFSYDPTGAYISNTVYFIASTDMYLLGVLNTKAIWSYAKERLSVLGDAEKGGRLRFFRQFVELLPIPNAPAVEREAIAALAQHCVERRGVGCEAEEHEIDERVSRLYGVELVEE